MLKYKNENGNFIQLLDEDYTNSYNYMYYGTTAPIGNKIWCDTYVPPFNARLLVDTDEGSTVVASKGTNTVNCAYQQVIIPNPEAHKLPNGYTELTYIQSSGTQWINSGFALDTNDKMNSIKIHVKASYTGSNCDFTGVYGNSIYYSMETVTNTTNLRCFIGNASTYTDRAGLINDGVTINEITWWNTTSTSYQIINDTQYSQSRTSSSNTGSQPLYIFARNYNGAVEHQMSMKLYSMQYYLGDILANNFIPCKNSSNVVGLYDLVSGTFFQNSGTGSFVAGDVFPQTITAYRYVGNLDEKGTWTVTATNGSKEKSVSVNITKEIDYNITLTLPTQIINTAYLYYMGDECTDLTGGYTPVKSSSWYMAADTLTSTSTSLHWTWGSQSTWHCLAAVVGKSINTSGYTGKCVVWKLTGSGEFWFPVSYVYSTNTSSVWNGNNPANYTECSSVQSLDLDNGKKIVLNLLPSNATIYPNLLKRAGIGPSETDVYMQCFYKSDDISSLSAYGTSVSTIIANASSLLSNENAVENMIYNCTGDFMWTALSTAAFITALNSSPYKSTIESNSEWGKALALLSI